MKEFKEFINEINTDKPIESIITFFIDNEWFGETIRKENGKIMLSDDQIERFTKNLSTFLDDNEDSIYERFKDKLPETYRLFNNFLSETKVDKESKHHIIDFMLYRLSKELFFYTDNEMEELLSDATFELIKAHGDILTFFIAWLKLNHKTVYQKDYVLNKRYTMDIQNEAYDFDDYIKLLYYLFSEEYIEDNEMFRKAAESKNYTDTWLYLALHFIRPLRMTDMERLYHPTLPYSSEEVIEKIKNDEFSDNDARYVLLSITKRMSWLPLTPNKTASASNVTPISFDIPTSCETLIGKLFALAQAHRNLIGTPDAPIVRKVSTYQEINRYMGEEIGELFLNNDFRSRSATKSFLQDIYMVADENIPADDSGYHVKGYYLAAYVRSHKGSYGHIASTTFEYLKDAKFSKLTPEFVAFELLERGVFSFMSSMLLKMAVGEKFDDLSPRNQTSIIKLVDLSPKEIETVVNTVDKGMLFAKDTLYSLITEETDILMVLHRIGSGEAFSKQRECLCLMSALEKLCPYANKRNCVGCKYEISTRSTLFLLIEEYNRIRNLYSSTKDTLEKTKYKKILIDIIAPQMDEMLCAIRENYGEDVFLDYERLIKENT
ncbi:MAG: hypothetical protein E7294_06955 [Lachnospiraceae bacterium]|nr:hypothetical protein [Lachnospiraceae bacterium]